MLVGKRENSAYEQPGETWMGTWMGESESERARDEDVGGGAWAEKCLPGLGRTGQISRIARQ